MSVAAAASTALPSVGNAASESRFLFVLARGGWDATRVFAPGRGERVGAAAGLRWRRSGATPSVGAFFEENAHATLICNGLRAGALGHGAALRHLLTGQHADGQPDWARQLAGARTLDLAGELDAPVGRPRTRRAADAASRPGGSPFGAGHVGHGESDARWDADELARAAAAGDRDLLRATEALLRGDADAATVVWPRLPAAWDTHSDSDARQDLLFDGLFAALGQVRGALRASGQADATTIVVLSELGRAPAHNARAGRDHWPFTSAMVIGGRVAGGRTLGGFDDDLRGLPADAVTGELATRGAPLSFSALGQGLLELSGRPTQGGLLLG